MRSGTAWRTGLESSYTADHTTGRNFWVNSISVNVVWDQPHDKGSVAHYSDPDIAAEDLLTWAATPAVRMPDVLAISDERITKINDAMLDHFLSVTAACPEGKALSYDENTKTYSAAGGWVESYPGNNTLTSGQKKTAFNSANIVGSQAGGAAECLYDIDINEELILVNSAYSFVQAQDGPWGSIASGFWPSTEPTPAASCLGAAADCTFETLDPKTMATTKTKADESLQAERVQSIKRQAEFRQEHE